ncbi:3-deoxy-D-manno-octulosonic acid transferase [Paraglaciecola aquimarina]|uniref:3-deoxy-D-manno-octulosonic acid transferase n=1 Tax=Paraglaciecola aquimarina TaxID=1235557 RepID=A0ABU3STX2_9ALTE|nr:3-deoxy-D-manno-octulosonic acid transferase [Paraglaciecola aquimarina]MDU0353460.1 3-deoxy-D-manno-octulosonic acid transferase [Paraglaciecola aquimarina]
MIKRYFIAFKQHSATLIYSLLWLLLSPFLLFNLLFRLLLGKQGYSTARFSRFGLCKTRQSNSSVLIHCSSVGEVVAVQNLVEAMLAEQPSLSILISTNTTTGADRVKLLFAERATHYYLPYDFPLFVWLFLTKTKPSKILINEMELWPNLCGISQKMNIPLYIINGRMSNKSTATYLKFPALFQPMLASFSHICAQGQRDYTNYLSLGIAKDKLTLTNNIKFEITANPKELAISEEINQTFGLANKRILVAGSTHDPEEQVILDAYVELAKEYQDLLLVIVPRHPQRFDKVEQWLRTQNIPFNLMSLGLPCTAETQVLLCDQMGKLRALFALADIAFIGGSIANRGGHNALEPAIYNVPILMGPSIYNNPAIHQTLKDAGAIKDVHNVADIIAACKHWFDNPELRIQNGSAGGLVIQQNRGAIGKTLQVLNGLP